jgi:hypothetical protein
MPDESQDPTEDVQAPRPYLSHGREGSKDARGSRTSKPAPKKRPVKLMLAEETYEAMVIHALRRGETLSELVERAVKATCQEFLIHGKPGRKSVAG